MAYKSLYNDIIFIEGEEDYIEIKGELQYKKGTLYNNQLKSLDIVKDQFATNAKQLGANAIINFKYGQKSLGWFRASLLSFDDNINWYGSGTAVLISKDRYNEIIEKIKSR